MSNTVMTVMQKILFDKTGNPINYLRFETKKIINVNKT